ncbi:aminotransferase class I/II-fold pyridoxal phosphate-dependent enzyme [Paenibacillus protaetiae]|uniref:Aminotransferase class I/II-fold pyridoxal phosphate-dependent enzyme n=1 Tax=Paenibacillus protaetiae TaxID=2509456 RepID=A0A4P6EWU8_9BACL|nr:aminotransferase class I/II-fold pyridoxal phosphate-dependent enzyme [Paenibacillus protaetiae]QAY67482.1 aminotransferase class I/II-fold pyridoxal phosphate-dependent enzyme [Paenibacillus protaetiae]
MIQKIRAPLFEALIAHAQSKPASFHVPGHRYGHSLAQPLWSESDYNGRKEELAARSVESLAADWFLPLMQLDTTELTATDDLHHPETSILEAQQLAARCYGSDETFFLVGGSTSGNLAMLLSVCEPGELMIVQRNVHKSVINGLTLAGAKAVFVSPEIDELTGIPTVPSVQNIEYALEQYPEAKAVLLSNPNYYGMGVHLRAYADAAHRKSVPLLVDEAHGAHYGFHPELPSSAIQEGADGVVQSAHKTLHALTMGAWLHVKGSLLQRERLKEALAMIQSSSPSFPIMASLDISRAIVEERGNKLFEASIRSAEMFRQRIEQTCQVLRIVSFAPLPAMQIDPLRICLTDRSGQLNGYQLQAELERKGCWVEMADPRQVLLLFGLQVGEADVDRLAAACADIDRLLSANDDGIDLKADRKDGSWRLNGQVQEHSDSYRGVSAPVQFGRELRHLTYETVPIEEAEQRLAAEMITPYPPGIPLVYPGEPLTSHGIAAIQRLAQYGAKFQGASDPSMNTIRVYKR